MRSGFAPGLVVTAFAIALGACDDNAPATQAPSSVERTAASTAEARIDRGNVTASTIDRPCGCARDLLTELVGAEAGGIVVLSIHDGVTTRAAAGAADDTGEPATRLTPFRVGSISKPFRERRGSPSRRPSGGDPEGATMALDPATADTIVVLTNNDGLDADDIATQIIATW